MVESNCFRCWGSLKARKWNDIVEPQHCYSKSTYFRRLVVLKTKQTK